MDAETLFTQLEFNTGEFPEKVFTEAVDRQESMTPLLLEELRCAGADSEALMNKGESYIRHIYAMYLLAQFRERAAYPLLVDFVATPGEIVMNLTGDVVTQDLGRMLASVCLSIGAKEQLGILARLAAAQIVAKHGGAPLIIDDALGFSDPSRLEKIGAAIAAAGEHCEIIILTCTPSRFTHVGRAEVVRFYC